MRFMPIKYTVYKYVWLYYGYDEFTLDCFWGSWGTTPLAIYLEQTTLITSGKRANKSTQNWTVNKRKVMEFSHS